MNKLYLGIFILLGLIAIGFGIRYYIIANYSISDNTNVGNKIVMRLKNNYTDLKGNSDYWNPDGREWRNKKSVDYANEWKHNSSKIERYLTEENIFPDKKYENKAVIHFRCSDSPFNKHPNYPLLPKEYYLFAVKKIEESGVDEILFLNCSSWNNKAPGCENINTEEKCNQYINNIADWLEESTSIPINRQKLCVSVKETYQIMLGSKIMISTGGSFSFVPGMVKGKNFISPCNIGEKKELYDKYKNLHQEVHWTMWDKFDVVWQKNIDYRTFDYNNYREYLEIK